MDTDGPSAAYAATTDESRKRTQRGVAATKVARTSKSAVSRVSKPAAGATAARPADWEVGDTAGLETCATRRCALPPHSKILAAHDDSDVLQCKEPGDTTSFLCVPYVLSRPILCQENKDLHNCSTDLTAENAKSAKVGTHRRASETLYLILSSLNTSSKPARIEKCQ